MKLDKIIEKRLTKERTAVISFGIFGIGSAISLLIFVGKLSDSMVVREIRQLVKNPEYKDPYGLDLDDILDTINIVFALGIVILLASIFGILANYFLQKVLMIIYFVYLVLCFICFVAIMLAAAIFQSEWKFKFKQESRRLWMVLKTLTDGQATEDVERELSCCGYNNALDYCDLDHVSTIMDEVFKDLSILKAKGLNDRFNDYDSNDDDLYDGLGSSDADLPHIDDDYEFLEDQGFGNYDDRERKRRADWEINADISEEEPPKKRKKKRKDRKNKQRKNKNHKKKSKSIDSAEPIAEFKNASPLSPDVDTPINFAGLFPTPGPSGIDDLHGNLVVNISWPFVQKVKPNECGKNNYEFLYREGDERCVCDQMLQNGITPAAETAVCITKKDQYGENDIMVDSVCGLDKFGEPICFLNGCGDIIAERIQTYIVPWIVVSVLVYTILYLGALISSFMVVRDRFKVDKEVIKNIRKADTEKRKHIRKQTIQSARSLSVRSRGKSADKSRNHTLNDEGVPLTER